MLRTKEGPSLPFLGHAITMLRHRPWDLLASWHRRCGSPLICFRLLGTTMFSVASTELCRAVLQSRIAHVKKDTANTMKPFLGILGTGIVTSEDEAWWKQRLKMSVPLRRDVLRVIPRQTVGAVHRLVLRRLDGAALGGTPVGIGSALRRLTLQVISGSFLSLSPEESDCTFAKFYLPIVEESNQRVWHPYRTYCFLLPSFWSYHYNVRRLNEYVSTLIRNRWKLRRQERSSDRPVERQQDVLDMMLDVYEKERSDLTDEWVRQLRDELKTFMLAGHETSAAMMTWTLYELMHKPDLMERVSQEADRAFENAFDEQNLLQQERLSTLTLSEACLKVCSEFGRTEKKVRPHLRPLSSAHLPRLSGTGILEKVFGRAHRGPSCRGGHPTGWLLSASRLQRHGEYPGRPFG
jgi:cytochrome P450